MHKSVKSDSLATDLPLEAFTCGNMSQQASQANHAYDSDANMDGRTDDEQEHQEPPASKEQQRVSSCTVVSSKPSCTIQEALVSDTHTFMSLRTKH